MSYEFALQAFNKYLEDYDTNNGSINLKVVHTLEVVNISEYIAKKLNLPDEDIALAKIIALLHDIGRFEQIKKFGEFNDKLIEHAEFGVKVLFDENLIRKFLPDSRFDNLIKKAIYNHNKYQIEYGLDEKELLHSKIIRDSDKLDNFRVKVEDKFEDMWPKIYNKDTICYEVISDKIYQDFLECKCINLKDRKTLLDYWACVIAFVFDLNFSVSRQFVKEKNYIEIMINRIEYKNKDTADKMKIICKVAKDYLANN